MNDESEQVEEPKPTLDDALMDPELILFPRIRHGEYPNHAVLRPQWLKSHSRYPFWLHHCGHWHWMTKTLKYAGDPLASPELGLYEQIDESERVEYTGANLAEVEQDLEFDPEKHIEINPPGEIEVIADTVPEKTRLGILPIVKGAMISFEQFWLENRSRIWETQHPYPEVVIEAPDWRYHVRRSLERPPENPMIENIRAWLLNMSSLGKPIVETRFGSFLIHKPRS
jgi:hypothetical protein